jgi:signal transduction histidine kinase
LATVAAGVVGRRRAHAPSPLLLWTIALGSAALAVTTVALGVANDVSEVQVALLLWISVPYVAAGLVAWTRRPDSRLGPLMVAGGLVSALSGLQLSTTEWVLTLGSLFDILPAALFVHVYLAYPEGRLRSDAERALVAVGYVLAIGLQLAKMMLGAFPNSIAVTTQPELAIWIERVQLVGLSAVCVVALGVLFARRRGGGQRRRFLNLLVDSFALGLLMIAVLFLVAVIPDASSWFRPIQRTTLFVVGLSPVVFLLGLLDARLARSAVGDLLLELRSDLPPAELRDAIARTLRDPTLTLAFWLPAYATYGDLAGLPVDVPDPGGRSATPIDRNGQRVAVLLHDPALDDEPELLHTVGAAAGMALENARLQAELAARIEEVKGSRLRAIEAGQAERKRLERNLHDGAQQRLVALSLQLGMLEKQLRDDPDAGARLDRAQQELALSLEELRDLARGIHPAVLTGHGLGVALEQVVARAPCPVRLDVRVEGRLPEAVEIAAYYVVTESLANMAKHAQATSATVDVVLRGAEVVVEVVDDGVGGADPARGSGIRGLADRVEALGGRISVRTPPGGGTQVRAEIPCA